MNLEERRRLLTHHLAHGRVLDRVLGSYMAMMEEVFTKLETAGFTDIEPYASSPEVTLYYKCRFGVQDLYGVFRFCHPFCAVTGDISYRSLTVVEYEATAGKPLLFNNKVLDFLLAPREAGHG